MSWAILATHVHCLGGLRKTQQQQQKKCGTQISFARTQICI